ncbi:MAG: cellulase family glycosylhydrolase [Candidatus Kariarchaeaceae archaeon]|jgi:hypothetical protein
MTLSVDGKSFKEDGRRVILRGVNLGGSTKMPQGEETHLPNDFANHREVSFVNRPFSLDDAPEHFARLHHWGFNCLRLLTTWEAIEHKGPGQYDLAYLDYFTKIVEIAGDYGFYVFIDPHQDVWSRMTGGDGAPGWTLDAVGLDIEAMTTNGAAKVMQYHYPDNYYAMEWFMNYGRFATATMFTLFFGSEDFAPDTKIDGKSAQDYLQSHFIDSMVQVAKRVRNFEHVIGFDALNEPNAGFIGLQDLGAYPELTPPGLNATPFNVIAAGGGFPRPAKRYAIKMLSLKEVGQETLNPMGIPAWKSGAEDIWRAHDIYDIVQGEPKLLRKSHFATKDGRKVDFTRDYLRPFATGYISKIREIMPDSLLFIEGDPSDPVLHWEGSDPSGVVNGSHWYDGFTLITKSYRSWLTVNTENVKPMIGKGKVYDYHKSRLQVLLDNSDQIQGGIPTLVGEFGIPFDMHGKKAYQSGNFKKQIQALDTYYNLMDELQLNSTLWNYTEDNTNKWGDGWNLEDFSIYSRDQSQLFSGLDSGGRALEGFCRPYPPKIGGDNATWTFSRKKKLFEMQWTSDGGQTEIYVPILQFPSPEIEVNGDYKLEGQHLVINAPKGTPVSLTIR